MAMHPVVLSVYRSLKKHGFEGKKILVAFSGGEDSLSLARSLFRLKDSFNLKIGMVYFHHGIENNNKVQNDYRNAAQAYFYSLCSDWGLEAFSNDVETKQINEKESESELREKRYQYFQEILDQQGYTILALGHHFEDLVETRMIRLIRGTGPNGLVAMKKWLCPLWRPLLGVRKSQIVEFIQYENLIALNDPSNESLDPLRNWIRNEWLSQLEKKRKGSIEALGRSLQLLSEVIEATSIDYNHLLCADGFKRESWYGLNFDQKRQFLVEFLNNRGVHSYSQSKIDEVIKRLSSLNKKLDFQVGHCRWISTREIVKVFVLKGRREEEF